MSIALNAVEQRVLGALIEKEMATPEYYPMSMNALVNACNQKNNREPVMHLEESDVLAAIEAMRHGGIAFEISGREHRVPKYSQGIGQKLNLGNRELAVLCVLLCRGPQTPGELRSRTGSLYAFEDLDAVQSTLHKLSTREEPLVLELPRVPGTKEPRWAHLLGDEPPAMPVVGEEAPARAASGASQRIEELEARVRALEEFVERIQSQLGV